SFDIMSTNNNLTGSPEATSRRHVVVSADHFKKGDLVAAHAELLKAIEAWPEKATAHRNMGGVLCHSERISDAIPYLERSLALEPNHTGAAEFLRQVRQGPVPEVDSKQQPTTDDMPPRPSPYGVAWAFLAAAAVAKLIGSWLSDSEADRASNLPFFQS